MTGIVSTHLRAGFVRCCSFIRISSDPITLCSALSCIASNERVALASAGKRPFLSSATIPPSNSVTPLSSIAATMPSSARCARNAFHDEHRPKRLSIEPTVNADAVGAADMNLDLPRDQGRLRGNTVPFLGNHHSDQLRSRQTGIVAVALPPTKYLVSVRVVSPCHYQDRRGLGRLNVGRGNSRDRVDDPRKNRC
jgi:hypothetical protein